MKRVIVSDIFGYTDALQQLADGLDAQLIIDPYDGKCQHFANEQCAYQCFSEHMSIQRYSEKIAQSLMAVQQPVSLLGFSAGASAIWQYVCDMPHTDLPMISGALLFYPGQIRYLLDKQPQVTTNIIFAHTERHFNVSEVMATLDTKKQTEVHSVQALHGFMNPHSDNFDKQVYDTVMHGLKAIPSNACLSLFSW
ncbi:hypothetical protein AAEU32_14670 [Pseudoalteromonas sp. SSDWG2]|uniref:hypothetical protein n=1 Tax=Pseudoalteromonas sp. SSDWG2 TaxID=3139391 RepID=UPI003BAB6554